VIPTIFFLSAVVWGWRGELGEQRTCALTPDVILIPTGTRLRALRVEDGTEAWTYVLREKSGLLEVDCRIQEMQVVCVPPPLIPGLRPASSSTSPAAYVVTLAGRAQVHALDARHGRVRWKATKRDGCLISLYRVGDVDRDGTEDLVGCGCNLAECFSGRTGAVLWQSPVVGRSLWAGPAGDLTGDGLSEVLLQAGTQLEVLTCPAPGRIASLFAVRGFFPQATIPVAGSVLVVFGGASVWRWKADGTGEKLWEAKVYLLDAFAWGSTCLVAAREGCFTPSPAGSWEKCVSLPIKAATQSRTHIFLVSEANVIYRLEWNRPVPEPIMTARDDVTGLAVDDHARVLGIISGRHVTVHQVEPPPS